MKNKTIPPNLYRAADGIIYVFKPSDKESFYYIKKQESKIRNNSKNCWSILVTNTDVEDGEPVITDQEIKDTVTKMKIQNYEVDLKQ